MSASAVVLLSYLLLAVFLIAFILRSVNLARLPIHLRWELAPVPHEKGKGKYGGSYLEESQWWTKPREKDMVSEGLYMFQEIAFLKALFEHKRRLWYFSFPFHFGLYLLLGAAGLVVLAGLGSMVGWAGPGLGILTRWLPLLALVAYGLGAFGAVGLFLTRVLDGGMRNSTSFATFFNVVLLGSLFATGFWSALTLPDFGLQLQVFLLALVSGDLSLALPGILSTHLLLVFVFLAYLPFTQMMHFVAKYFTYHDVRWDDRPLEAGGKMEKELLGLLQQPVSWAGPHVRADGRKNWVDLATDSGVEEVEK